MEGELTQEPAKKTYELSDLDEDADIDVVTQVQPKDSELPPRKELTLELPEKTEIQETEAAHERSASWGGFIKKTLGSFKGEAGDKCSPNEQKRRDWTKEQEALAKLKSSAVSTLSHVGSKFNEGGTYLFEASKRTAQATAENLKKIRLLKTPIESICRNEAVQHPCPRVLLICCTAIASSGLSSEDIFAVDPPEELVHAVSAHFLRGSGAVLPPNGASPEVLAGVIKKFLMDLDEPLLTFKLLEEWMKAGVHPQIARQVMEQLPPANFNALDLLLDCLNRIASNVEENQMDADRLAQSMGPCLLWKFVKPTHTAAGRRVQALKGMFATKGSSQQGDSEEMGLVDFSPAVVDSPSSDHSGDTEKRGREELNKEELQNITRAISYLISNYKGS